MEMLMIQPTITRKEPKPPDSPSILHMVRTCRMPMIRMVRVERKFRGVVAIWVGGEFESRVARTLIASRDK